MDYWGGGGGKGYVGPPLKLLGGLAPLHPPPLPTPMRCLYSEAITEEAWLVLHDRDENVSIG